MKTTRFIQIGGVINLLFVVFHLLSAWTPGLAMLPLDFRPLIQVLNIHLAYALAIFFVLSLFFPNELSTTKLGRIISLLIAGFWVLRAVNEAVFWGISLSGSWIIIFICLAVAALYLIPSVDKRAWSN